MKIINKLCFILLLFWCGISPFYLLADAKKVSAEPEKKSVVPVEQKYTILILNATPTWHEQAVIDAYQQELIKQKLPFKIEIDSFDFSGKNVTGLSIPFAKDPIYHNPARKDEKADLGEKILCGNYQLIVIINNDNLATLQALSYQIPGNIPKIFAVQSVNTLTAAQIGKNVTGVFIESQLMDSINFLVKQIPNMRSLQVFSAIGMLPKPLNELQSEIDRLYPDKTICLHPLQYYKWSKFFYKNIEIPDWNYWPALDALTENDIRLGIFNEDFPACIPEKNNISNMWFNVTPQHSSKLQPMFFVSGQNNQSDGKKFKNSGGLSVDPVQKGVLLADLTIKILRDKIPPNTIPIQQIKLFQTNLNLEHINSKIFIIPPPVTK